MGEAFSGKHYTLFGSGQVHGIDLRGILERVADELLSTARETDGKDQLTKVHVRLGYITKKKLSLEGTYQKVINGHNLLE